jgi:uncharacterized membrane protein HdeD (DUF308 family)
VRGAVALFFGGLILESPGVSLETFAFAFGIFALASGTAALVSAARLPARSLGFRAAIDLALGALLCLRRPWTSLLALNYLAGAWAMATGILEMFAAGAFHRDRPTERLEAGAGALAIALGFFLGVHPENSLPPLIRLTGLATLGSGLLLLVAAWRLRRRDL